MPPIRAPAGVEARAAVADRFAVELVRARLLVASDLYGLGRTGDARAHLEAARQGFAPLARRTRPRSPRLHRELVVAFEVLDAWTARGVDPDRVRERVAPVADQLMEGVLEALVPRAVRFDPGMQATVLGRLLDELEVGYRRGHPAAGGSDPAVVRARQRAYGLLARSQITGRAIEDALGPARDPVLMPLSLVRAEAFPGGLGPPPPPEEGEPPPPAKPPDPRRVSGLLDGSRRALEQRLSP